MPGYYSRADTVGVEGTEVGDERIFYRRPAPQLIVGK